MPRRDSSSEKKPLSTGGASFEELQREAKTCKACDLWKNATQTVFGEGGGAAPKIMFVGEQPGDQEDLTGKPFVGPAGKLLDKALLEAGIDRRKVYVTNAVKHFKWEPRGKRRIHKKPNATEIAACRRWLDAEIALFHPKVIVCLGATAAQALLGKDFRVTKHRGERLQSSLAPVVMATVHPSSILRAPDEETRHLEMKRFVADLKKVAAIL
jgi:uracil-DNA glycosylase family protein